jgi:16S rRNA (guanine527-N7)-methyltransferase
MEPRRINELLEPFLSGAQLSEWQVEVVQAHLDLLLKWNAKINLTAVHDPEEIIQRHFGESFFAARQLAAPLPETAIDIGSGAGFPGLPLKLWLTDLKLTLVESNGKKATFLREVTRVLELRDVTVLCERAETISAVKADLVTLRAVERFGETLPTARKLTKPGGRLALLIGNSQAEIAKSKIADANWGLQIKIPESTNRVLIIGRLQPL